jgi:hypothetical protein
MKGGRIHEQIIGGLKREFEPRSDRISVNAPCKRSYGRGFIDLLVTIREKVIAIEAENTARRVANDIQKARAIQLSDFMRAAMSSSETFSPRSFISAFPILILAVRIPQFTASVLHG